MDWRNKIIYELRDINDKLDRLIPDESEHNLKEPAKKEKVYSCDKCDFTTTNRHKYAAHGNKHKD